MAVDLLTLDQAKGHLRIAASRTDEDDDIGMKVSQASQMVMTYIKRTDLSEWEVEDSSPPEYAVPADILGACCIALSYLFDDRNSDKKLPQLYYDLLAHYRLPSFA